MNTSSHKHIEKYNQVRPYVDSLAFFREVNPPIIIDSFSAFNKRLIHLYGFPKHVGHYTDVSLNCLFSCDFLSITLDHWVVNDFLKTIHY